MRYSSERKTEHHRIPKNGVDVVGTNDPRNRVLLPEHRHVNIHRLFGNLEFHYKVLQLLEDDKPVLCHRYAREVQRLMSEHPSYIYQNGVYVPRNY